MYMSEKEYVIAYYRELAEDKRLYDRLIWQIPTLVLTITTGIVAVAYSYVQDDAIRAVIFFLGIFWVFAMLVVTIKHQYFGMVQRKLLILIEHKYMHLPPVQRFTRRETIEYLRELAKRAGRDEEAALWSEIYDAASTWNAPHGLERLSAWRILKWSVILTLLVLMALEGYSLASLFLG